MVWQAGGESTLTVEEKPSNNALSIGLIVGSLVFGLVLIYVQYHRLTSANADLVQGDAMVNTLKRSTEEARSSKGVVHTPAVVNTTEEDTDFLRGLREAARESNVEIVKWTSTTRPAGTNGPAPAGSQQPVQPAELKGLTEIVSDLEVFGDFDQVRNFITRLESSPRLLNMDQVDWRRGQTDGTRLSMILTRYVSDSTGSSDSQNSQNTATSAVGGSSG